jgi:hypothetical protein
MPPLHATAEALRQLLHAARYRPTPRPRPTQLPAPADPGHDLEGRVSHAGTFRCQTRQLCSSATLLQEESAVEETGDGIWSIAADEVLLARLDTREFRRYACQKVASMFPVYAVTDVPGCYRLGTTPPNLNPHHSYYEMIAARFPTGS